MKLTKALVTKNRPKDDHGSVEIIVVPLFFYDEGYFVLKLFVLLATVPFLIFVYWFTNTKNVSSDKGPLRL